MQVSGANDYRLRDNVLEKVLAGPVSQPPGAQVEEAQQGAMLLGPGRLEALDASWSQTVGSLQSKVSIVCCSEYQKYLYLITQGCVKYEKSQAFALLHGTKQSWVLP